MVKTEEIERAYDKWQQDRQNLELRDAYFALVHEDSDERFNQIARDTEAEVSGMSDQELIEGLGRIFTDSPYKGELLRREQEKQDKQRRQEKEERTNAYRADLIHLNEIVGIIELISQTETLEDITLKDLPYNGKAYKISKVNTQDGIEFKVSEPNGKIFQIGIKFITEEEPTEDQIEIIHKTAFSICFSCNGKSIYFVGKTDGEGYRSLQALTVDELIENLTPKSATNNTLSWDYVKKNKDIIFSTEEMKFISYVFGNEVVERCNKINKIGKMLTKLPEESLNAILGIINRENK